MAIEISFGLHEPIGDGVPVAPRVTSWAEKPPDTLTASPPAWTTTVIVVDIKAPLAWRVAAYGAQTALFGEDFVVSTGSQSILLGSTIRSLLFVDLLSIDLTTRSLLFVDLLSIGLKVRGGLLGDLLSVGLIVLGPLLSDLLSISLTVLSQTSPAPVHQAIGP